MSQHLRFQDSFDSSPQTMNPSRAASEREHLRQQISVAIGIENDVGIRRVSVAWELLGSHYNDGFDRIDTAVGLWKTRSDLPRMSTRPAPT